MAGRAIGLVGDAPTAQAYAAAAEVLGWQLVPPAPSTDTVAVAPIAATLAAADALADAGPDAQGRLAFGWPLISTTAMQELLRRAASVGTVTDLSTRSTRPVPDGGDALPGGVLLYSAHDQIALVLLLARLVGLGAPLSVAADIEVGANGLDDSADVTIAFADGRTARVHADWRSTSVASQEVQLAGDAGVLRSETDPRLSLEFNGEPVPLPSARVADEAHRPLHEAGVIAMLKTVGAAFDSGALPFAFTTAFGRDVLDVIIGAYAAAGLSSAVALPFDGDRNATPRELLLGGATA